MSKELKRDLRSGQLISTFGIGQIINFPGDDSLMVAGLDAWDKSFENAITSGKRDFDKEELKIREKRLELYLNKKYFIKPFPYKRKGQNSELMVPAVRFPRWHHCLACGKMERLGIYNNDQGRRCSELKINGTGNCGGKLVPVRFVAACTNGHIEDVPFMKWVHGAELEGGEHKLYYHSGFGSGDLSSIKISCSCGVKPRTLAGITGDGALHNIHACQGHQPWLGAEGEKNTHCDQDLKVLIRGGSNVHYAKVVSSIYLPEQDVETPYFEKIFNRITREELLKYKNQSNDDYLLKVILENQKEVKNKLVKTDELLAYVNDSLAETGEQKTYNETTLRLEEYNFILSGKGSEKADFKAIIESDLSKYDKGDFLSLYFDCVVKIERLKETRAYTGFARIQSEGTGQSERIRNLSIEEKDWLPAQEVYGEGIFLKFKDNMIKDWYNKTSGYKRRMISGYHASQTFRNPEYIERDINETFLMMHTFSHLLIKRLCFNCGYGSSALRERIYFSSDPDTKMSGILIYTSSGDSEGSMGGLVRQANEKYLGTLVLEALEDARWCSADPVCSDIGREIGQGPNNLNGAACHNCAIIPETSCEEFNTLLDRSLVVGDESFFGKDF